jgi:D-glycero-D-manno-heptose 1,7-bisphosphate phosphatase
MNPFDGKKRRAVFLDRDGVINVCRRDHVKKWDEFEFLPGALQALAWLAKSEFLVIVTTNQAAIHRQMVDDATVRDIHARMKAEVERGDGRIHAVYYCPHLPEENCDCRKPKPGMYLRAEWQFGIDLRRSYVIGDTRADVEVAHAIGAQPILVLSGWGCDRRTLLDRNCRDCDTDCVVVDGLSQAVEWIGERERVIP